MAITRTFSEAFDEIYKLACELYRYPKSFRPSMKKERLPLETVIEGVSILLSLSSKDNIIVSLNKHPKIKPMYRALKKVAWKHNLNLEKDRHRTYQTTQRPLYNNHELTSFIHRRKREIA